MTQHNQLIDDLQAFLEYKKEEGFQTLEVSPTTLVQLKPSPATPKPKPIASVPVQTSQPNPIDGEGKLNRPDILFVGEDFDVDKKETGRPFLSEAGQLLGKMILAIGYEREEVFILNISKDRPQQAVKQPGGDPALKEQIKIIQPKLIVALGKIATERLLGGNVAITRMRGTWKTVAGIDLMPTLHPTYLLHSPDKKREVWADLKAVLVKLGKNHPATKSTH